MPNNCASCHGETGEALRESEGRGFPMRFGRSTAASTPIVAQITRPRAGVHAGMGARLGEPPSSS